MIENIDEIKTKTISGLAWRFGERISAQLISFIVSIVLARILMPEEYGIISLVTIFITLANVFVTNGLGTSLIQKKDADETDFSTMFWTGLGLAFILYIILFMCAPVVAKWYHNSLLTMVIRIMGLRLPIAAVNSIQQAYVSRKMIYKKFFFSTIIGTIISAIVGITMAFCGCGVWALVFQYLTNVCIDTIVLFVTIDWRPKFVFSYQKFKNLFSFGWKVMLTSFIGTLFDQLKGLIIGVKYTSEDLAYYNKGEQIPALVGNNINYTVESVLFPAISKVQEDKKSVKKAISRSMKISAYIIMPLMFGIAAVSEPLIKILLTDKWLFCVPYLKIICMQQCIGILGNANLQSIKSVGRSDILLKLEIIKKPIYLAILIITMQISPLAIAIGNLIYNLIAICINAFPNKKILDYNLFEQIKDIAIPFLLSITMGILVMMIGKIAINMFLLLTLQVIIGMVYYITISIIFRNESFIYICDTIKTMLKK